MTSSKRTDLAVEARDLWKETAGASGSLPGVSSEEKNVSGFAVTTVRITDEQGAKEDAEEPPPHVLCEVRVCRERDSRSAVRHASDLSQDRARRCRRFATRRVAHPEPAPAARLALDEASAAKFGVVDFWYGALLRHGSVPIRLDAGGRLATSRWRSRAFGAPRSGRFDTCSKSAPPLCDPPTTGL